MKNEIELNGYLVRFLSIVQGLDAARLFSEVSKLTKTEFRILREILVEQQKGGHIISSELARRVGVTRSAISQIVSKLEERDVLVRSDAPDDKKIAYVEFSPKAYDLFNKECARVNTIMEKVVNEVGERKMETWLAECDEIIETVRRVNTETQTTL